MTAWSDLPVTDEHATDLTRAAIDPGVAIEAGVRSVTAVEDLPADFRRYGKAALPGLVFEWTSVIGDVRLQLRPDEPVPNADGESVKYLFAVGTKNALNVHPRMRERVHDVNAPLVVVEGTKQYLAAVSALSGSEYACVGVAGCFGWSSDGRPVDCLTQIPWSGREVVICFDADIATNRNVYDAAAGLSDTLIVHGAGPVKYIKLPGNRTTGLDDVLATLAAPADGMRRLIQNAAAKLPRRPPAKKDRPAYFGEDGNLLVDRFSTMLRDRHPMLLAGDETVAVYTRGVYRVSPNALRAVMAEELGDLYRPAHRATVEEYTTATLYREDARLPERVSEPVVNVTNGMLDLRTGELKPHSAAWHSAAQLPIAWDPAATCPTYERWLATQIADQADDLEECASTMLDPSRTPSKAIFLYGPSRSGKSTFLRLMVAVAGNENTSAVTLHQLSDDKYASAELYGKILNTAADLSSAHVSDLSLFKMLTGEDLTLANRKYGREFKFTNTALFAFSANAIPTVSETSGAYFARVKPFAFSTSFAGAEDPGIEVTLRSELPGILVRWVRAWQRIHARGSYAETATSAREEFEEGSDRVRRWVAEERRVVTEVPAGGSFKVATEGVVAVSPGTVLPSDCGATKTELFKAFGEWVTESGMARMNKTTFISRLTSINGVYEVRLLPNKTRGINVAARLDDENDVWSNSSDGGRSGSFNTSSSMRGVQIDDLETVSEPHGRECFETATDATSALSDEPAYGPSGFPPASALVDRFKIFRRPGDPIFRPSQNVTTDGEPV